MLKKKTKEICSAVSLSNFWPKKKASSIMHKNQLELVRKVQKHDPFFSRIYDTYCSKAAIFKVTDM